MFKTLWKNKNKIIFFTIVCFIFTAGYNFLLTSNKATMTLTISYPGTEKGENPNGTRFNVFEIKSSEVIDRAISNRGLDGLTVDDIRNRIDIYAKIPKNITERVTIANTTGKDFSYISNEFSISYSQQNKLSKNNTISVLEAVAEAYTQIFQEKHTEKNIVLTTKLENLESYEYVEIADMYFDKVSQMERYIRSHASENGAFVATSTNQNFQNILTMLQNFKNIEVEKFKGYIVSSALSKNKNTYIQKLKYNNSMLSNEREKVVYEKDFTTGAIQKYDPNITGVAFIPSLDQKSEFYMNRTKIGIDYLTEKAYDAGVFSEKIMSNINSNNKLIEVFSTSKLNGNEYLAIANNANEMLKSLDLKLTEIARIATDTDKEYLAYKTKNYLKFNIPKVGIRNMVNIKQLLAITFISFIIICVYFMVTQKIREMRFYR
jgi:hypothetical protein